MKQFFDALKDVSVLVIGDLILDRYTWGEVNKISPEAPIPVVNIIDKEYRLGGAGNVANNLISLGCRVSVASVVGDDKYADKLFELMSDKKINTESVLCTFSRTTTYKNRIMAGNQQITRIDQENTEQMTTQYEQNLIESIKTHSPDIVIISDYAKGVLTPFLLQTILGYFKSEGIRVIVDPKGKNFSKYYGAYIITPNLKEYNEAASNMTYTSVSRKFKMIYKLDINAMVITKGNQGIDLYTKEGAILSVPIEAREVFDVSGAGDTVIAMLAAALAVGEPLDKAVMLANKAAGIVVGKVGTSVIEPSDLYKEEIIVFTNGCFDLLHTGHVSYLQAAKVLGTKLIVGVNSDSSVKRLKGGARPLMNACDRIQMLEALGCVDVVVLFEEDTPINLIKMIKPDVLVKGKDYVIDDIVGKEFVENYGGRVATLPIVEGKSTTGLINKVIKAYDEKE